MPAPNPATSEPEVTNFRAIFTMIGALAENHLEALERLCDRADELRFRLIAELYPDVRPMSDEAFEIYEAYGWSACDNARIAVDYESPRC